MATWITHLRIAGLLQGSIPDLLMPAFLVGSIAPDSGMPDRNWEHFEPPPEVTHFKGGRSEEYPVEDMRFFRSHLAQEGAGLSADLFSFRLGYFFHLLTDNLWIQRVDLPTRRKHRREFAVDQKFIWTVKKDWYSLDFVHLRKNPGAPFWQTFLEAEIQNGDLGFLPLEAVAERVRYIRGYYQGSPPDHPGEYSYLTETRLDAFVQEAVGRLVRIYDRLWHQGSIPPRVISALSLLD